MLMLLLMAFLPVQPSVLLATPMSPMPMNWTTDLTGAFHDVPLPPGSWNFFILFYSLPRCQMEAVFPAPPRGSRAQPVYTASQTDMTLIPCLVGRILRCDTQQHLLHTVN